MSSNRKQRFLIVASSPNYQDTVDLLKQLASDVSDVNTSLGIKSGDTIELRKAINMYLKSAVDTLLNMRQNKDQGSSPVADDDPNA